jgi:hypothetical protein
MKCTEGTVSMSLLSPLPKLRVVPQKGDWIEHWAGSGQKQRKARIEVRGKRGIKSE